MPNSSARMRLTRAMMPAVWSFPRLALNLRPSLRRSAVAWLGCDGSGLDDIEEVVFEGEGSEIGGVRASEGISSMV